MNANEDRTTTRTAMNPNDFPPEFLNQQQAQREDRSPAKDSGPCASIRGSDLLLKEEVYQIVGCALEVINELGHGLHEKPYENALVVEFGLRRIPFVQQPHFDVTYKQVVVGEYRSEEHTSELQSHSFI